MTFGKPSRQVLRRAAIRARRVQRSLRRRGRGLTLRPLAVVVAWTLAGPAALANPMGGQVAAGAANIASGAPGTLNVFQKSERAVINWHSFGIGAGEVVNFLQPTAGSVTLNRVVGPDPSAIFGRLSANGTVMLVNPNGIVFGPTARVDVGGLVATTANIRDSDFMAGRYAFDQASPSTHAAVENQGRISIQDSGLAALVAPRVRNAGVIEARLGRVALGAANTFTLDFHGDGLLSFGAGSAVTETAPGSGALVTNSGEIRADGGTVLLTAQAVKGVIDNVINTDGLISATTVASVGGRIVLSGGDAGTVAVGGSIDVSAAGGGQGGTVVATGEQVRVAAGARIDASGRDGGGEIALGSTGLTDPSNPFANKSASVNVAAGATLNADATGQGDGGNVTLWSTDTTIFDGRISARGGARGGDGGFAEVSSQKNIGITGDVDLRADKGRTGTFLIDPTDLRITDTPSGGSQDGNATDGSVAAGDADQGAGATLNTVSRGLLEGLAGNANIVLQATGQITIDAMAGGAVNFQTTAGNGVTLQSTQTGGIRFVDANTALRTQGGSITLEALGVGGALTNIGRLSTSGGAVTLRASGSIELAGAIDAATGTVQMVSTAGSITNAGGAAPQVSASAVSLTAGGGHIGAAGSAISTHTTRLAVQAGGDIFASSDMALTDLSVSALHAAAGTHTYQIDASGLSFALTDGSTLSAAQIAQAGLNLTLLSDRSIALGTLDLGSGTLTVTSSAGNLSGAAGNLSRAASVVLTARGSNGNNGAIGTSTAAVNTATPTLSASAGSGGAFVANTGALTLAALDTTGGSAISATGTLTAARVSAGAAALALSATGGDVVDDGNAATRIAAGTLSVAATGAIGSPGSHLQTSAATLNANTGAGGIHADLSGASANLASIVAGNGPVDITTAGTTILGTVRSATSAPGNGISIATTGTGQMTVGSVDAGAAGTVSLTTQDGNIFSGGSADIQADRIVARAGGPAGSIALRSAAAHLDLEGTGVIAITQNGNVALDNVVTSGPVIQVSSTAGDIAVGNVRTALNGTAALAATAGAIVDDGDAGTRLNAGTATLTAAQSIGTGASPVQTSVSGLSVDNTGDVHLANSDNVLTSLSVTNRHATPGVANVLQISAPFLAFDVTDDGTQYAVDRIVGASLNALNFSGDQTAVIGQVQAGPSGAIDINAMQGDLLGDGNTDTRITGNTVTLRATQGHVGRASAPLEVNTSMLTLATRGDLFVNSIADLATLSIASTHPDATSSYGMAITAPSLAFAASASAAGQQLQSVVDSSGLDFSFTGDRNVTLGWIDVRNNGSVSLNSTGGNIADDGDKATHVLANTVSLSAEAIGAAGTGHLDVIAGTLDAAARSGGIYIDVPTPTGGDFTNTLTLTDVQAAGTVEIASHEGDLVIAGNISASGQAVRLTAERGSILNTTGSVDVGNGALSLNAGRSIGSSTQALYVSADGAVLDAQAGTDITVGSFGALALGSVNATPGGTVSVTAMSGSLRDDGNAATVVTGGQVNLAAANGALGSGAAALGVDTTRLSLTARNEVAVDNAATLAELNLTRTASASGTIGITAGAGQTFDISGSGGDHLLAEVRSSSPLAFGFSGTGAVNVGTIDTGAAGSVSLTSTGGSIANAGPGASIAAGTVSLASGASGSVGTSSSAIALDGTTRLSATAGRNIFVESDAALASLSITSTNANASVNSQFGVSASGLAVSLTDSGSAQTVDAVGAADFSFTSAKSILVSEIVGTGEIALATTGTGLASNIEMLAAGGRIHGSKVTLATAASGTAGGGNIGTSGSYVRVDTPALVLSGGGNMYVGDAQNLSSLDMTVAHRSNTTYGYGITAGNISAFAVTDGATTQSLGLAVAGSMDFSYSADRALSLATIDVGTSTTGSVSITSRSAPSGANAQINRSSGSVTGGSVSFTAVGTNGGVGAAATLSTSTQNLSIASSGNVSVSNSSTLQSLGLDLRHRTTGASTHSYAISSTGLTLSISDTLGVAGMNLANISQSGLNLAITADRTITASSINTGSSGSVTLSSTNSQDGANGLIQGGSGASAGSPSITTGQLTLNAGSAQGYNYGANPLYTAVNALGSNITSTLYLSNNKALTLEDNSVGSSARVSTTAGSILQGTDAVFTAPYLVLTAAEAIGATGAGNTVQTDAHHLTLSAGRDIAVHNASDLYGLDITSTHAAPGTQNTVAVTADRLDLALTDSAGGNQYTLDRITDASGIDFRLRTDVDLVAGSADVGAGHSLVLESAGINTSITNSGSSTLVGGRITLSASGSVGAAGDATTRMQTDARSLTVSTGANAFVDNAQDLLDLSFTSAQVPGGSAPTYSVTAPSLTFDVTSDGTTTAVNQVRDTTGLNLALNTNQSQEVHVVDVLRAGTVALTTYRDLLGSGDPAQRITAGSATLSTTNYGTGTGGAIGAPGQEIQLSSPLLTLNATGSVNIVSDTHIDRLAINATHPVATSSTYAIASVPVFGSTPATLLSGTDSDAGTVLASLNDADGLAFSFDSDRAITVGDLNLGATGTVALSNRGSGNGIAGDGVAGTQVRAASLSMGSDGGAIGAAGAGNSIEATVAALNASANGGGAYLNLHGRTALGGVSANGAVSLANDVGDIALGAIDARGNAVTIDNQGGSILSGSIANTSGVTLLANGSIGNQSALSLTASGSGTTTLAATAAAAHGADGSIAIEEGHALTATSVVASGAVTLRAQNNLAVGTITGGDAVTLASSQGGITGIDTSNAITGASVVLDATYGSNGIGSSGTRLQVDTTDLTVNTPASFYITGAVDLETLVVNRATSSGSTSSGTLSVVAPNLVLSATDSGNTTTLTSIADTTGLDFSYQAIGRIAVGSIDVGGTGSVDLRSSLNSGSGTITAINSSSRISAGSAALTTVGTAGAIGSSSQALGLSVGTLAASTGSGGIHLTQAGSLTLDNLYTTGDLSVTATAGDLTLGAMGYGANSTLSLTASAGSILAGNVALTGSGAASAINLSAANGIGAALAPILVNGSAGTRVSATVTGTGSLYLGSTGTLAGGLTTSVANGATQVTAAGNILLRSMSSGTDAVGNDIRVTASTGNITVDAVSAGANARYSGVNLSANAGSILATGAGTVTGSDLNLFGANGVGTVGSRMVVNGQSVQVATDGGAAYLATSGPSVLTNVATNGGQINVATAHDLLIANASSGGGAITISSSTAGVDLLAGNIDAGAGNVLLSSNSTGGTVQDDGTLLTRIVGNVVQLVGDGGVGNAAMAVQTRANSLNLASNTGGTGIHLEDDNAAGVALSSVVARGGAVVIEAAGALQATSVMALADATGNDVTLRTRSGDITVGSVSAGANHGAVALNAAGSIIDSGSGSGVSAHSARLTADGNIGVVTDLASGAGTPLRVSVSALDGVATTGADRLVHILNTTTGTWTLGAAGLTMDAGGSAYLRSAGNLDVSGMSLAQVDNLLLSAAGTLTLPTAGLQVAGALNLTGSTDVVSGAAARELVIGGSSVVLRSGAAGGATTLATTTGSLDAALTGAGALTVNNTGTLAQATLQTLDGDITATSSAGLAAQTVVAGGANRTVSLTASTGDLTAGTVDAGAAGTVSLTATDGRLLAASSALTASTLNLTSGRGIGSSAAAIDVTGMAVNATVTGVGDMYLSSRGALNTGTLATAAGDITVAAEGDLTSTGAITAGQGGAVSLASVNGSVTLAQAFTTQGDLSVTGQQLVLNGGSITTGGAQSYYGALVLGTDTVLTGSALGVNGSVNGPHALTVDAGSGGVAFNGAIGDASRLGALAVNSAGSTRLGAVRAASVATDAPGTTVLAGDVDTTGTQTYGDRVTLAADTTLTGATVTLAGGVDGATAGGQGLTVEGDAVLGSVGAGQALAALTVNGASTLMGAAVATTGAQTYNGALVLGADQVLDAGTVAFNGTIDGAHALTVSAGTADVVFDHAVGGSTRLGALTANTAGTTRFGAAVRAASVTTDAPGTAVLAGDVDTTGTQTYGGRVTLAADTALTGATVTLAGGVDAATAGGQGLTVQGDAVLGSVGAGQALAALTVNGASTLMGAAVATTGAQTYNGALVLGADQVLDAGTVAFNGTIDGAHALTVSAGTADVVFDHAVGGSTRLGALTASTAGTTRFGAAVRAASVTTDAPGTVVLAAPVDTTGAQTYNGALMLEADTVLTGSALSVNGSVNGPHALTVDAGSGGVAFNGAIGDASRLGALAVNSAGSTRLGAVRAASVATDAPGTTVLAGDVDTTGTQTYGDRVTLAANTTLTGATVTLAGGVDGATAGGQGLTVEGDAVLGSVGAGQALAALTVNGASTLMGAAVATTGAQTYNGALVLGADQVLDAGTVAFNGTIDGAHALTVNIGGAQAANASTRLGALAADTAGSADVVFDHAVGGSTRLGALTVNTAGVTRFDAAVQAASVTTDAPGSVVIAAPVDTTGTQHYGEAVTLLGDQILHSSGGSLVFGSTVDGTAGSTLTLRADAGDIDAAGAVRVGSLVSSAEAGQTRFRSTLMAEDADGLQLSGMRFVFDGAVTASTGMFSIANTSATGSVNFAAGATVEAATGFTQTGGAAVYLPSVVRVAEGPISLQAPAYLPDGAATLSTQGDITLSGLTGAGASVTMAAGPSGVLTIGRDDALAEHKLDVAQLTVSSAASAQLFGRIGGRGGAAAAASVAGGLVNAPYYMNGTPWGPIDLIATVTASTVAGSVVPSMPRLAALFTGNFSTSGVVADALAAFRDPAVLTVSSQGSVLLPVPDERDADAPAGAR